MTRFLLITQIFTVALLGLLAYVVLHGPQASSPAHPDGVEVEHRAAPGETAPSVLEARILELEAEDALLREELDELGLDLFSLDATVDDVQSLALKNDLLIRSSDLRPVGALPEVDDHEEGVQISSMSEYRAATDPATGETLVDPVFDAAVRSVLSNIALEKKRDREQSERSREAQLIARLADRLQLTAGQVQVVQGSLLARREAASAIREELRGGHLDRKSAHGEVVQIRERFNAELQAVLTPEQFKGVKRALDRRADGNRKGGDRERKKQSRSGGGSRQGDGKKR